MIKRSPSNIWLCDVMCDVNWLCDVVRRGPGGSKAELEWIAMRCLKSLPQSSQRSNARRARSSRHNFKGGSLLTAKLFYASFSYEPCSRKLLKRPKLQGSRKTTLHSIINSTAGKNARKLSFEWS